MDVNLRKTFISKTVSLENLNMPELDLKGPLRKEETPLGVADRHSNPILGDDQKMGAFQRGEESFDRVRLLVEKGFIERNQASTTTTLAELKEEIKNLPRQILSKVRKEIQRTQKEQCYAREFYANIKANDKSLLNKIRTRRENLESISALFEENNDNLNQCDRIDFKILREIFSRLSGPLIEGGGVRASSQMPEYNAITECYSTFRNIIREAVKERLWLFNKEGEYSPIDFLNARESMLSNPDVGEQVIGYINKIPLVLFELNQNRELPKAKIFNQCLLEGLDCQRRGEDFPEGFLDSLKKALKNLPEEITANLKEKVEKALVHEAKALQLLNKDYFRPLKSTPENHQKALQSILDLIEDKEVNSIDFQVFAKVCLNVSYLRKSVDPGFLQRYLNVSDFFNRTVLDLEKNNRLLEGQESLFDFMARRNSFLEIDVSNLRSCNILYLYAVDLQEGLNCEWEMNQVQDALLKGRQLLENFGDGDDYLPGLSKEEADPEEHLRRLNEKNLQSLTIRQIQDLSDPIKAQYGLLTDSDNAPRIGLDLGYI